MQGKDSLSKLIQKGYVKLGRFTETGMAISYLNRAQIQKIESGDYIVIGMIMIIMEQLLLMIASMKHHIFLIRNGI